MKELIYIGMDFHKKTRSVEFLNELLEREYIITFCFIDLFSKDPYAALAKVEKKSFDILVCFQVMPPRELLDRYFRYKHAVFFPMYDGCPSVKKPDRWFAYRDFQIISFCRTLAEDLRHAGFSSQYIQYFPKPPDSIEQWGGQESIFFWNRHENINIQTVELLFSMTEIRRLHVHKALDPGSRLISPTKSCTWEISYSDWYESREEMREDMLKSAFYIAPRRREGIGMSFLEAMSNGRCVIAPDNPTMNEYITHGRTGFLYNLERPIPPLTNDVEKIQRNTYRYMCEGYEQWCCDREKILDWLEAPVKTVPIRLFWAMFKRFFRNPIKVARVLKRNFLRRRWNG